ncbi:MAG: aldo/keto reductase [Gammaproteobacteria bacterium]|jgi:aryl-alcohol dehydrogenase-like predicted oxidoreductase|nr:aldo/keto reductase [Gammaproteobacteria bacterium]
MISRRDCLKYSALAGLASVLPAGLLHAAQHEGLITRAIPKTGEKLPIVGLGSSASFRKIAASDDTSQLSNVIKTLLDNGGTVFDTAPSYGESERVAGEIVQNLGATENIFWATKVNVLPRGGSTADADAARAQIERSFDYIGKDPIDLIQVHNLRDIPTQMGILKELKEEGRVRYIGTTYTGQSRFPDLADVMRNEPIDFIGVNYAVDDRNAADQIFPVAEEHGVAVLVYVPFGRSRLWQRVAGRDLPEWAAEIGVESWGQFFIKFAAAHPAVTCVTPATSKPHHMLDNLGAAVGELPDAAMQQRMASYIDGLPSA